MTTQPQIEPLPADTEPHQVAFGLRLRHARNARFMTTRQLGACLSISHGLITMIERGQHRPTDELRVRLSQVLGDESLLGAPAVVKRKAPPVSQEQRERFRKRAASSPLAQSTGDSAAP